MKRKAVEQLSPGLYRLYWKSGGSSLAAVGCDAGGARWMAPINWISFGTTKRKHWRQVKEAVLIQVETCAH